MQLQRELFSEEILERIERRKEFYAFTYEEHIQAAPMRGYLSIKQGDAYDTKHRWTNSDISGANEATQKIEVGIWRDLENVRRDHQVHPVIKRKWGHSPNLNGRGKEWFSLPIPQSMLDAYVQSRDHSAMLKFANDELVKVFATFSSKNKKRAVKLRKLQRQVVDRLVEVMRVKGVSSEVIAELAPRFGKTITFLHLFKTASEVHNIQLMLLPAYWLSVFTSFSDTIAKWRDYENFVFIDAADDSADEKFRAAKACGKKAVVAVSLHSGSFADWQAKHAWIANENGDALSLLDEADYGSHTENQREKIDFLHCNKQVFKIVTSGTNVQRMAKGVSSDVADHVAVPYVCLEEHERESNAKEIILRRFFQVFVAERLQKLVEVMPEHDAPAWSKILEKCHSQRQFISSFFRAVYGYDTQYGLDIDGLVEDQVLVSMVFVNCTKKAMKGLGKIISESCPEHHVVVLNGDHTTNRDAEWEVKAVLRQMENGLIERTKLIVLSRGMGSRSYSVGDCQAVLFLTDGGSLDTFTQAGSRCCDPVDHSDPFVVRTKDYGYVLSYSLDRNRTRENLQLQVVREAYQLLHWEEENGASTSFPDALTRVCNSVNLKSVGFLGECHVAEVTAAELFSEYEDSEKLLNIAGITTDYVGILANKQLVQMLSCMAGSDAKQKAKFADILRKGKTREQPGKRASVSDPGERESLKAIANAVRSIINSSAWVLAQSNYQGRTFKHCLEVIASDSAIDENFKDALGITASAVLKFLPYLPVELLDMAIHNERVAAKLD